MEKTDGARTADEEDRASSEMLFRILLQHMCFYIKIFGGVIYSFYVYYIDVLYEN